MSRGIRAASPDDAAGVAAFFSAVYEVEHGRGSADALEMLQRTVAVLFPDTGDAPAVYVYEIGGTINGVGAVRHREGDPGCELLSVQVHDTVQGRGIAQTLLNSVIAHCKATGIAELYTLVPLSDVRARGFLRREGFVADLNEGVAASGPPETVVRYVLALTP